MLINLAYLLNRPTGTTSYALNLLPYLAELSPSFLATPASGLPHYIPVPDNMTAAEGTAGHLRRLWWTQFQVPKTVRRIERSHASPLLFSPIPEIPLSLRTPKPNRCRSVVTFHDLIPLRFPNDFGAIKYYYRYYVPQVLTQAEQVICNSEATARDVVDFYGIPARKLSPIPLAYDADNFRPVKARPVLPDGFEVGRPYFLMLGRQAPYKNVSAAIQALSKLPNDYILLIAGPTDERYTPELEKLAEEKGVRSRLKFLSYVPYDQLPALLSSAIALIFPSLWEGFGLPVLEAMACGTPVIASAVASVPEVAGDAACLIDPLDFEEIAGAMGAIAADSQMRQQLSDASLQRAKHFSWVQTGQATVQVLKRYL